MRTRRATLGWWGGGALLAAAAIACLLVVEGPVRLLQAGPHALADPVRDLGPLAPVASLVVNALTVVVPVPGSPVALVNGALFGPWAGALLNLAGGLAGAALCFWIGRSLAGDRLARMLARRSERWARPLARPGGGTIAAVRLSGASYGLVSYLSGATGMAWWPFLWGTAAGTLPRAAAYAALGSAFEVPFWATLAIGPVAAAAWFAGRLLRRRRSPAPAVEAEPAGQPASA
jgi:uncharacterized membrane protein YdjX (TVP38/TMEM64 family)